MEKICCFCKHFYLDMGDPGYSELTPGYEGSVECLKGHWKMRTFDTVETYRENILTAKKCKDWEFFKPTT